MNKTSIIKLPKGSYTNDDVYECVITYVMKKDFVGGYLLPVPLTRDAVLNQFYSCEIQSQYFIEPKIRHFIISVSKIKSIQKLLLLGEQIAFLFCPNYQVVYSLDLETGKYHLHFAVNNYNYHPNKEPLTDLLFEQYLKQIKIILQTSFPSHMVMLDKGEGGAYYV